MDYCPKCKEKTLISSARADECTNCDYYVYYRSFEEAEYYEE